MTLNSKKYSKPSIKLKSLITTQKILKKLLVKSKSIEKIRKSLDKGAIQMCGKPIMVYNYKDIILKFPKEDINFRVYRPSNRLELPIVIYLHGGSWIGGSIETHDNVCRKLCRYSSSAVVSIGYRLAPEHPFPTALLDIYKTIMWVYTNSKEINGDNNRISIVGDSAGGNLAAAISYYIARKGGPKINCQVLIYPSTNIYEFNSESWNSLGDDIFLRREDAERFIAMYVPDKEERKNPFISPIYTSNFEKIPPTLIITAEFDPLRDEGVAYYSLLKKGKVDVSHIMIKGVHHGFITMDKIFNETDLAIKKVSNYIIKYNKI